MKATYSDKPVSEKAGYSGNNSANGNNFGHQKDTKPQGDGLPGGRSAAQRAAVYEALEHARDPGVDVALPVLARVVEDILVATCNQSNEPELDPQLWFDW